MDIIACADAQWNIGKDGKLLFKLPPDMKRFRELTVNKVLVMGRKTLGTLPAGMPLPGRKANIVITSDPDFYVPGAIIVHTLDELLQKISEFDSGEIFVIGGSGVYTELAPYCKRALITQVNAVDSDADTTMPDLDEMKGWSVEKRSAPMYYEGMEFEFVDYVNSDVKPLGYGAQ